MLGLETKSSTYSAKVDAGTASTSVLHSLAWSVDELQRLLESARKAHVEVQVVIDVLEEDTDMIRANVLGRIAALKSVLIEIVRGVFWYSRTAATHVLVIMISTESRSRKPYALPVQCIPCVSLKDGDVRKVLNNVVQAMANLGMKVAGKSLNYNYILC